MPLKVLYRRKHIVCCDALIFHNLKIPKDMFKDIKIHYFEKCVSDTCFFPQTSVITE